MAERRRRQGFAALLAAGLLLCAGRASAEPAGGEIERRVEDLLARMSLEEKLGQLNLLSAEFAVTGPQLNADYRAQVRRGEAGGIFNLYGAEQVHVWRRSAKGEWKLAVDVIN